MALTHSIVSQRFFINNSHLIYYVRYTIFRNFAHQILNKQINV